MTDEIQQCVFCQQTPAANSPNKDDELFYACECFLFQENSVSVSAWNHMQRSFAEQRRKDFRAGRASGESGGVCEDEYLAGEVQK